MSNSANQWSSIRKDILSRAISIGLAVAIYGVSFGALGASSGFSIVQTQALSLLMFTGGSQFGLVSTVASGGTAGAGIAAAWLLGLRNSAYSMRMAPILQVSGPKKMLAAHLTIDESTGVALSQAAVSPTHRTRAQQLGFWATGLSVFVFWNIATFIGSATVNAIGDPRAFGLDAAIAAGLFALVWPQIKNQQTFLAAFGGALVALLLTPVLPPGIPVLAAAVVAIVIGWSWTKRGQN